MKAPTQQVPHPILLPPSIKGNWKTEGRAAGGGCSRSRKDMFLGFLSECSKSRCSGILRTREKQLICRQTRKGRGCFPQRSPSDYTALCSPPPNPHPELTQSNVNYVEGEDVDGEQRQGKDEEVEVTVVPLPHAVPHPGAVMVKSLCRKSSHTGQPWPKRCPSPQF